MKSSLLRLLTIVLIAITTLSITGCNDPGEDEFNKGIEAERENNLVLAEEMFKVALKKDPTIAEAHINLGFIYMKNKEFDKAWEETTLGLDMVKRDKKTIVMGGTWQDQAALGYNNLSKIIFEKAVTARKNGDIEGQQSHKEHAVSLLKQALEMVPEHEMATKNLSYVERWPN